MKRQLGPSEVKIRTVSWDYKPKGPFHVVRQSFGYPVQQYDNHKKLSDAIDTFVMTSVPTHNGFIAYLHDRNGAVLVGYMLAHPNAEAHWYGVEKGFEELLLHEFMDPLEGTIAEIQAKKKAEIK